MDGRRKAKRIEDWRPVGRRIRDRPRKTWLDDVMDDLRCTNIMGCRRMCNERAKWKKAIEQSTLGCNGRKSKGKEVSLGWRV